MGAFEDLRQSLPTPTRIVRTAAKTISIRTYKNTAIHNSNLFKSTQFLFDAFLMPSATAAFCRKMAASNCAATGRHSQSLKASLTRYVEYPEALAWHAPFWMHQVRSWTSQTASSTASFSIVYLLLSYCFRNSIFFFYCFVQLCVCDELREDVIRIKKTSRKCTWATTGSNVSDLALRMRLRCKKKWQHQVAKDIQGQPAA